MPVSLQPQTLGSPPPVAFVPQSRRFEIELENR
jgi:hypothetical protein